MSYVDEIDVVVGAELDFEVRGNVLFRAETPDGIHCNAVNFELLEDNGIRLTLQPTAVNLGEITITTSLADLERILAEIRKAKNRET